MIKSYFQLVRFPGIFTAFSNILVGFFIISSNIDWNNLILLLSSSGFLFMSGMIFNDFADSKIDAKERPNRPIPSGKISSNKALLLGVIFLFLANFAASNVNFQALHISLLLTSLILLYNFKTKNWTFFGILTLSTIRFFNVLLGMTAIGIHFEMLVFALPVAILVAGISILAKNEVTMTTNKIKQINKLFLLTTVVLTSFMIAHNPQLGTIFLIILFSFVLLTPYIFLKNSTNFIQKNITIQLFSIIFLDSIFVSQFSNFYFGIFTASLFIPAFLISRKLYVT